MAQRGKKVTEKLIIYLNRYGKEGDKAVYENRTKRRKGDA